MTGFNQYKRALLNEDDQKWHLAPELLEPLARKDLRPLYDFQKADVYSLALVALELGTGKVGLYGLYNYEELLLHESI